MNWDYKMMVLIVEWS